MDNPGNGDSVILIHGMGRTANSMFILKKRLEKAGYHVLSESYPSTKKPIADHVKWLEGLAGKFRRNTKGKIHFITHSLGGIILRFYLMENKDPNLGRVVMLSPPNKGSELVDVLKDWKIYQNVTGPSGQELGTGPQSTPNLLGPVDFELGVITGDVSFNPLFSMIIPGPDDGKVSVKSARIEGMKDFLVVKHSHTFIMNSSEVAEEIISFLKTGAFLHSAGTEKEK